MSIKRYDITGDLDGNCNLNEARMEQAVDGSYVKHSDYAALEQQLAESQSKLAQMAAENAGLKECNFDIMKHVYRSKTYLDSSRVVDAIQGLQCAIERNACKTTATEAFLAEVRASAVDSLIDIKTNQLARMHPDTHAFGATADFIRSQINELQSFAALLRKGVQS